NGSPNMTSTLLPFLLPDRSHVSTIFARSPSHAQPRTRATSSHPTASAEMTTCGLAAAPLLSIPVELLLQLRRLIAKNLFTPIYPKSSCAQSEAGLSRSPTGEKIYIRR